MRKHQQNRKAVLSTICYSDIFDYPLDLDMICKYIIGFPLNRGDINEALNLLVKNRAISHIDGYYCLRGREKIINLFKKRKETSSKKILKAKKITAILRHIPTIKLIGISGSLSLNNAKENDDIDLFFISATNTIWITRIFVLFVLQLLGARRGKFSLNAKDKICANMFLDESSLVLPFSKQNLYTAHEVAQMKPIFEKHNMHSKFLFQNAWVKKFLPNAKLLELLRATSKYKTRIISTVFSFFENLARAIQISYMRKNITTEIITPHMLAFHPKDMQAIVLKKFDERIKKYAV